MLLIFKMKEESAAILYWNKILTQVRVSSLDYETNTNKHIHNEYLLYLLGTLNSAREAVITLTDEWNIECQEEYQKC